MDKHETGYASTTIMNPTIPGLSLQNILNPPEIFSDSRLHGYQGPSRFVRLGRVAPNGTAVIAKSEDGSRCAVAGKECEVIPVLYCSLLRPITPLF